MPFYILACLLIVGLFWVVWHPLGAAIGILMTGHIRTWIVNRAAFWNAKMILTVGIVWGMGMAMAVRKIVGLATSSRFLTVALLVEGLIAVRYVGFQPAPEDLVMYDKAGQTATVGIVAYLLAAFLGFVIGGWPH
jgi:hypothetical protein